MVRKKTISSDESKGNAPEAHDLDALRSKGDSDTVRRVLEILKEHDRGLRSVDPREAPQWTSQVH